MKLVSWESKALGNSVLMVKANAATPVGELFAAERVSGESVEYAEC